MELIIGANTVVPSNTLTLEISLNHQPINLLDFSAYLLDQNHKVRGDDDMVFYGQTQNFNRTVCLTEQAQFIQFTINLAHVDVNIQKIAICATMADQQLNFSKINRLNLTLKNQAHSIASAHIDGQHRTEAALILGEFYRYHQQWKFRLFAQGFNGGLKPLSEYFGVEISDTPPAVQTAPVPPKPEKLSLSKISLDKQNNKINLTKKDQVFGEIKINLNWNQKTATKQNSFFDKMLNHGKSVDLDLGCLFEMQDGTRSVIQALGDCFGNFHTFPFIELSGDDRTGALQGGEWLRINGKNWDQIHRVVIFAFIYQGVPNWAETDAVVTIYVPEQPPIEIRLIEGQPLGMCGIVELVNQKGNIEVRRHVEYVKGHKELDRAFNFGLRWVAGSK